MIKNIIFDLSEVIISGYIGVEKIIEKNTSISSEKFLERKKETINIFLDTMRGKYSEDEYLSYLLQDTNWKISKDELKLFIRENLNRPVKGTMNIIKTLKENYNLILLSDNIKEWMNYIFENNEDLAIFDHKYFSYDIKGLKLDEDTFEYIINDLNIKPEETIFIDDYEGNVQVANKNGIKGIIFKNAEQLTKELEEFLIKGRNEEKWQ